MPVPLSPQQKTIWLQERQAGAPGLFNVPSLFSVAGDLDGEAFCRALRSVVARHAMLRARFYEIDDRPVHAIVEAPPLDFELIDATGQRAENISVEEFVAPALDLSGGVPIRFRLLRLAGDRHLFLIVAHHLVWDAGSEAVFLDDLTEAFAAGIDASGRAASIRPDFERGRDGGPAEIERARLLETAAAEFAGLPADPAFAFAARREDISPFAGVFARSRIDRSAANGLARLAKAARVTPYVLLLCLFRILIAKCGRSYDFLVATPMSLRTDMCSLSTIGCLTNVTAVRNRIRGEHSFLETLAAERAAVLSASRRRDIPLHELLTQMADGAPHSVPVSFSYSRTSEAPRKLCSATITLVPFTGGIAQFDIAADVVATESGLDLLLACRSSMFEAADAERLAGRFAELLGRVVERPDLTVAAIDAMDERDRSVFAANECRGHPASHTALDMFLEWADRTPDAPAVRQGEITLSYRDLLVAARQVAGALLSRRFPAESAIALLMERSAYLPAALLGIALAGHAVVPLDPGHPAERLEAVMRNAGVVAVVLGTEPPPLDLHGRTVIRVSPGIPADEPPAPFLPPRPDSLAYILYTSGSTGGPKGVAVAHLSVGNCLAAAHELLECGPGRSTLSSTTIAFDIAMFEILLPLTSGGTLILADQDMRDGGHVRSLMERHRPDYFQGTPAVWKLLFAAGWAGQPDLVALIGGDIVTPALAARIRACTGRLWHTYGPTEATLFTLAEEVLDTEAPVLPVGTPLAGTQAYVLDPELGRCAPGTVGELYIGGVGLARGYVRMPCETAASFLPNPFAVDPGERLYRTGDRARLRVDGRIEILGRADRQIKIRGFRIELEEVERTLARAPAVADCVTIVVERDSDRARLVACIEPAPGIDDHQAVQSMVREYAEQRLPAYMRPSDFRIYEPLPLGPTGKVDRSRLLRDALAHRAFKPAPGRPGDSLELAVAQAWAEALGGIECGPGSDFVALGGTSITATLAAGLIRRSAGVRTDPITILLKPRFEDFMGEVRRELTRERFYAEASPVAAPDRAQA